MSYTFLVDKGLNVLFAKFEGEITSQNLSEFIQESFNHPDWQKGQNSLCDFRDAELVLSSDEMQKVIRSFSHDDRVNKLAMIVSRDLEFGMSRMFEILTEETSIWKEFKIFREIADAKLWMGLQNYSNTAIKWLT